MSIRLKIIFHLIIDLGTRSILIVKAAAVLILCLVTFVLIRFVLLAKTSERLTPAHIGLSSGRLQNGPDKPNWVSSQTPTSDTAHFIEPLLSNKSAAELVLLFEQSGEARLKNHEGGYLHFEYRSWLFGFVDDLELLVGDGVIQVKSSSRVGYSDMGANRKRVENLRQRLAL